MTCRTANGIYALRSAAPTALFACILARDFNLGLQAKRGFTEGYFQIIAKIGASFWTSAAAGSKNIAKSKKLSEDVTEIAKSCGIKAAKAALHSIIAVAVIARALFGIAQNAVGFGGLLKSLLRILVVRILIRMVFQGKLTIGTFYLLIRRMVRNPKYFVAIPFVVQHAIPTIKIQLSL